MLNISSIINSGVFSTEFQVENRPESVYTDGIWQDADPVITNQVGSITPATANDMLKLPEGERQAETLRLITQYELKISKNSTEADIIIYLGERYRVVGPNRWNGNGFNDVLIQKESDD